MHNAKANASSPKLLRENTRMLEAREAEVDSLRQQVNNLKSKLAVTWSNAKKLERKEVSI